ncbi:hypothetical protein [Brachybacterium squillarum]|uniref:hypothetical protein n=1 Tax=Brachybacterium squillarum TaxID=661979 RepID=UPI0002629B6A|nr:hypothetical protein [Brachybacterium squillarum]
MSAPGRPEGDRRSEPVSALMVPLLFLGLVIGFLAGYVLLWWGALVVAAVLVLSLSWVLLGRNRDAVTGLLVGTVIGYLVVLALAFFRGVLF